MELNSATPVYAAYNGEIVLKCCDMFSADGFASLKDGVVDAVITDLPYGVLNKRCGWDKAVDYDLFWPAVRRVRKPNAAVVTTAIQPFTTALIQSNLDEFKYNWVWEKSVPTAFLNAYKQPLRSHEDICVFYDKQCVYNPQKTKGEPYNKGWTKPSTLCYGAQKEYLACANKTGERFPRSVIYFPSQREESFHNTQKPVDLMEYLVRTYTDEGDLVLDPCVGSGTTAIACIRSNRRFIGFERETQYFDIAVKRIEKTKRPLFNAVETDSNSLYRQGVFSECEDDTQGASP